MIGHVLFLATVYLNLDADSIFPDKGSQDSLGLGVPRMLRRWIVDLAVRKSSMRLRKPYLPNVLIWCDFVS